MDGARNNKHSKGNPDCPSEPQEQRTYSHDDRPLITENGESTIIVPQLNAPHQRDNVRASQGWGTESDIFHSIRGAQSVNGGPMEGNTQQHLLVGQQVAPPLASTWNSFPGQAATAPAPASTNPLWTYPLATTNYPAQTSYPFHAPPAVPQPTPPGWQPASAHQAAPPTLTTWGAHIPGLGRAPAAPTAPQGNEDLNPIVQKLSQALVGQIQASLQAQQQPLVPPPPMPPGVLDLNSIDPAVLQSLMAVYMQPQQQHQQQSPALPIVTRVPSAQQQQQQQPQPQAQSAVPVITIFPRVQRQQHQQPPQPAPQQQQQAATHSATLLMYAQPVVSAAAISSSAVAPIASDSNVASAQNQAGNSAKPWTKKQPVKKKRKYNHEAFPQKLHRLIREASVEGNDHIVRFNEDGTRFTVLNTADFETILPRYFRHGKISSFFRMLHLYDFKRVQGTW